jgi:hypothetical protein
MSRAVITIRSNDDRLRAHRWAMQAPIGCRLEFKEPKRSLPQNDLMWSRLTEIATQVEWHGQHLSPTDWKDMFTASLRKARVVPNLDGDGFVLLGLHTSDMSKEEMTALLDLMDAFAAERGVTFREMAQ